MAAKKKNPLADIDKQIKAKVAEFKALRPEHSCYPLLIRASSIAAPLVDDVDRDLSSGAYDCPTGKLTVIIDSSGGDIHAAYNLGTLLRTVGHVELEFVVPRWAKSAATLLCCAGDRILMTPTAELGPLDPQITQFNPMENRMERFSPLHIESTLELIREEYANGHQQLADKLMERLQFPLTLGSIKKSLEVSEQYLEKLLSTRMLKTEPAKAKEAAKHLARDYSDHGYCINIQEAKEIGLRADLLAGMELAAVRQLKQLCLKKSEIEADIQRQAVEKKMKSLPAGVIKASEAGNPTRGAENTSRASLKK